MSNKKKNTEKLKLAEEQTEKLMLGGCLFLTRLNLLYAYIINKKQIRTINMSSFSIF